MHRDPVAVDLDVAEHADVVDRLADLGVVDGVQCFADGASEIAIKVLSKSNLGCPK